MKALVTGGAGFIGSHIVDALIARGDKVRVFDNLSTGDKENLAHAWKHIEFVQGDIRNTRDIARAMAGVQCVFHEAALRSVERSVHDPSATHEVDATGTLRVLIAARDAGVKRVVYASSSSVYGENKTYPQTETLRPGPISPYAAAKFTGETYCVVFAKTFGLETVSLRYFNVFGPRQAPTSQYAAVIPKFMEAAYHGRPVEVHWDGRQSRDFTYIQNVVDANLLAAGMPGIEGEVFNIACGQSHSLLQILKELEKITGRTLTPHFGPKRAGDIRKTLADIRHAKRKLRYKPAISLRQGLERSWEWFVSQQKTGAATNGRKSLKV